MNKYHYKIEGKAIVIQEPADESGQYKITWEGTDIGHLFVDGIHHDSDCPIWKGTTTEVNLYADELGAFIQQCSK